MYVYAHCTNLHEFLKNMQLSSPSPDPVLSQLEAINIPARNLSNLLADCVEMKDQYLSTVVIIFPPFPPALNQIAIF